LIGWHLLMPPMGNNKIYETAPLSMCQIIGSFDTPKDCKNLLLNYKKHPTQVSDRKLQEA